MRVRFPVPFPACAERRAPPAASALFPGFLTFPAFRQLIQRRTLFSLPKVPYAETGLPGLYTPHGLDLHLNKHHQAYVTNANKMVAGTPFENAELVDVIRDTAASQQHAGLYNQVGQIYNHNFFWETLAPQPAAPAPAVVDALTLHFGSVDKFKEAFTQHAMGHFGSGWVWLVDNDGQLEIENTPNAVTPIQDKGKTPLLVIE